MSGRTRSALATVVVALGLAVASAPASAAGTLDQQQTASSFGSGVDGPGPGGPGTGGFSDVQTVIPQLSGGLVQVDLDLQRFAATTQPLTVEIFDDNVFPFVVLATATVPAASVPVEVPGPTGHAFITVPFADPGAVVAGHEYVIGVYVASGSDHYGWRATGGDPYAPGGAFGVFRSPPPLSGEAGYFNLCGTNACDFAFKTYVTQTYDFSGFFSPVNNPTSDVPVNGVKAGSSVPVKFSLGGDQGLGVLADGYPKLTFTACDPGDPVDPVEETSTANNGLTYNALTDTYTYVWKTQKSWAGKCGTLTVKLDDASVHTADFQFK
jgi:hypothetical protein